MFEPNNIARRLKLKRPALTFRVTGQWEMDSDAEISIEGTRVHVQVGENYLIVARYDAGVFHHWPNQRGLTETLLKQLDEAIADDAKTLTPEALKEYAE